MPSASGIATELHIPKDVSGSAKVVSADGDILAIIPLNDITWSLKDANSVQLESRHYLLSKQLQP